MTQLVPNPHAPCRPNTYACRSLWLPGSSVESPPDFIQNELFNSPASSEGWISLNGKVLADHPGQYILTVSAFSGWFFFCSNGVLLPLSGR